MIRRIAFAASAVLAVSMTLSAPNVAAQNQSDSQQPQAGNGRMGGGYGMMGPGQGMGPGMMGPGYGMQQGWMGQERGMGPGYGPQGRGYGQGQANPEWHQQMHEWMQNWRAQRGYDNSYQMPPGMMRPGYQMGPGMMGPGQMGPGMMLPGQRMGPGMMGPGYGMGPGMMYGPEYGVQRFPDRAITTDDVRAVLEQRVARNPNLKVGKVEEEEDRIVAEVVTKDGSLVSRFEVDPETGRWIPAN